MPLLNISQVCMNSQERMLSRPSSTTTTCSRGRTALRDRSAVATYHTCQRSTSTASCSMQRSALKTAQLWHHMLACSSTATPALTPPSESSCQLGVCSCGDPSAHQSGGSGLPVELTVSSMAWTSSGSSTAHTCAQGDTQLPAGPSQEYSLACEPTGRCCCSQGPNQASICQKERAGPMQPHGARPHGAAAQSLSR